MFDVNPRSEEVVTVTQQQQAPNENAEKDPAEWVTGDEPMTGPQRSYLHTLALEAGREIDENLSKAQASELIDELQNRTGRGA
jgi:alkyl hydroperoxide reductase subunit AhpC